jgi:hypothetical protein
MRLQHVSSRFGRPMQECYKKRGETTAIHHDDGLDLWWEWYGMVPRICKEIPGNISVCECVTGDG